MIAAEQEAAAFAGAPAEAPEQPGTPPLTPESRLRLRPLTITPEGESWLVGDPSTATFLALPEIGVVALRALQEGRTIREAAEIASASAGEPVDVLDFAATLIECGLVAAVDHQALAAADAGPQLRWLTWIQPGWVRPLFSRGAWALYGLAALLCIATLIARPDYWPGYEDFFFYPDPAVCLLAGALLGLLLGACHELCHWLAGRALGVTAGLSVSRRMFVPVFETDLSPLWAVPRRQRYSPFLAGMAFDTMVLALCLGLRLAWGNGWVELPALLYRLLGALALSRILALGWQTLVFLRTDLYAVAVTALGCLNLSRVTALYLKGRVWRLRADEAAELAAAHPRDRQIAPWFGLISLAGVGWMLYTFATFFIPSTVVLAGWMFGHLRSLRIGSLSFWEALVIGGMAAAQALAPLAIFGWQSMRQRRRVAV